MSVTWTRVWTVVSGHNGTYLVEKEASHVDALQGDVTLRPVGGGRSGASRYQRPYFTRTWGTSPAEAVEKYLAQQHAEIGNLQAQIAVRQMQINQAELLKEKL